MLNVQIILHEVVDLTETSAQIPLNTNAQELTGDWKGYDIRSSISPIANPKGIAPTQELGLELFKTGVEGFRSISARVPDHKTLTVFVDNLRTGISLRFSDPSGSIVHHIP